MRTFNLFLTIGILVSGMSCSKEESKFQETNLIGTWIEKNPELYDEISDTLIFTNDSIVSKHFYFNGWKYSVSNDSISFKNNDTIMKFKFSSSNESEIVIYNFLDRLITSQVKNIYFTKIK